MLAAAERRIDTADGHPYTMQEFLAEYGNLDKWNRAAPRPLQPGAVRLGANTHCAVRPAPPHPAPAPPEAPQQPPPLTEQQARELVAALTPAERQAAVLRAGGRQEWTGLSWVDRLRVARSGAAPAAHTGPAPGLSAAPAPAPAAAPAPCYPQPAEPTRAAAPPAAAAPRVSPPAPERRIDEADGNAYTQAEFIQEYGAAQGSLKWSRARSPRPVGPDQPALQPVAAQLAPAQQPSCAQQPAAAQQPPAQAAVPAKQPAPAKQPSAVNQPTAAQQPSATQLHSAAQQPPAQAAAPAKPAQQSVTAPPAPPRAAAPPAAAAARPAPALPPAPAQRRTPEPERAPEHGGEEEEGEDRSAEDGCTEWIVAPPLGANSCAWRRSPNMQDKLPQQEAPFAERGRTIRGAPEGDWVRTPAGLYLPKVYLVAADPDPPRQQTQPAAPAQPPLTAEERRKKRERGVVLSWDPQRRGGQGTVRVGSAGGSVLQVHHSELRVEPGATPSLDVGETVEFWIGSRSAPGMSAAAKAAARRSGALSVEAREVTAPGGGFVRLAPPPSPDAETDSVVEADSDPGTEAEGADEGEGGEPPRAIAVADVPCKEFKMRCASGWIACSLRQGGTLKCGDVVMQREEERAALLVQGLPEPLCGLYRRVGTGAGRLPTWSLNGGCATLVPTATCWEFKVSGRAAVRSGPHEGGLPQACAAEWTLLYGHVLDMLIESHFQVRPCKNCRGCNCPAVCVYDWDILDVLTSETDVHRSVTFGEVVPPAGEVRFDEEELALSVSGQGTKGEVKVETRLVLCADKVGLLRTPAWQVALARNLGRVRYMARAAGVPCHIPDEVALPAAQPEAPQQHRSMDAASAAGQRPVCMRFAAGHCHTRDCAYGVHQPLSCARPQLQTLFAKVSPAKHKLIEQKWRDAGGHGELRNVWEVRNPRSAELFRLTEHNLAILNGTPSVQIDAFHGTAPGNVLSIAVNGFDPSRRNGQAYGSGEYFAKNPGVSMDYCEDGRFMFLCKLHLGEEGQQKDHVWVDECKYYIVKQRKGFVQALPMYVLEFPTGDDAPEEEQPDAGGWRHCGSVDVCMSTAQKNAALCKQLTNLAAANSQLAGEQLVQHFRGARQPCKARRDAAMHVPATRQLWLGWLQADMSDEELAADVRRHLHPIPVADVVPERNAMRLGAFVTLGRAVSKAEYGRLCSKPYRGQFEISVDDESPDCPVRSKQPCPRLTGPSKYCRGWNLRGTAHWRHRCRFAHDPHLWPTHGDVRVRRAAVRRGTAKYDEVCGEFTGGYFADVGCGGGQPGILRVYEVVNPALERLYLERKAYLEKTFEGVITERELWHGTHSAAVRDVLRHGLQPPSDASAAPACPHSAGKGCTSLCSNRCKHCAPTAHCWEKCHMYGLGIYLADLPEKSHRYVRAPEEYRRDSEGEYRSLGDFRAAHGEAEGQRRWDGAKDAGCTVYAMLRCQTNLGSPYLIEGNLLRGDAMHDVAFPCDPSDMLDRTGQEWDERRTNSSYFVKGQGHTAPSGKAVFNNEYVVFQPWQVWPRYLVLYTFDKVPGADFGGR